MSGMGGIGAVGAMGAMGVGMGAGGVSAVGTGGLNGPLGDFNAATINALSGTRMGQLEQLLNGFSTAEIMIALLMSGLTTHRKHDHGSDDAAMGMLLGLAMASQMSAQAMNIAPMSGIPAASGATGQMINLMA